MHDKQRWKNDSTRGKGQQAKKCDFCKAFVNSVLGQICCELCRPARRLLSGCSHRSSAGSSQEEICDHDRANVYWLWTAPLYTVLTGALHAIRGLRLSPARKSGPDNPAKLVAGSTADTETSVSRRTKFASPPGWSGLRIRRRPPPRRAGPTPSNASRSKANWCSRILEASAILISLPAPG